MHVLIATNTHRTLQELIAPRVILFFDANHRCRGTKETLSHQLSIITAINERLLVGKTSLAEFSVAQKMSWAASRRTTRKEDEAYALLGIFDLNLPLLYGEREKAFRRLQEEIVRTTVDLSILGWKLRTPMSELAARWLSDVHLRYLTEPVLCGVLAHSPEDFAGCGDCESGVDGLRSSSTSNTGIKIHTRMHLLRIGTTDKYGYVLPIASRHKGYLGIKLRQVDHEQYLREDPYTLLEYYESDNMVPPVERYLLTKVPRFPRQLQQRYALSRVLLPERRFYLLQLKPQPSIELSDPWPLHRYDHEDRAFFGPQNSKRDFGIINLTAYAQLPVQGSTTNLRIDCRFCAFGWYQSSPGYAQFSLIESRPYDANFAAIQPWVSDWDRDSLGFMSKLDDVNVPKQSGVVVKLDNLDFCVLVSFEAKLEENPTMSTHVYWSVALSCRVYRTGNCPAIRSEAWRLKVSSKSRRLMRQQTSGSGADITTVSEPALDRN